jgi:hypothetical protein
MATTDAELRERFTEVPWDEPITISSGGPYRIACRLCIARFGLRGDQVDDLYQTREEWEKHMTQFHGPVRAPE